MNNKYKGAIIVLENHLIELLTKVSARKMVEIHGSEEDKKTMAAGDFMSSLFTGKVAMDAVPAEATQDFQNAEDIAFAINILKKAL